MISELTNPRLIVGAIAIILIIVAAAAMYLRTRRKTTAGFRARFGSEYDRAVLTHGSERKAEATLADRETRVENLNIRELNAADRERFTAERHAVESRFIDYPKGAVTEADDLVSSVLQARGYPVANFEQRAADISVDHPRLVQYYRSAHAVAVPPGRDEASTEDLRTAMIGYRSLFDELVGMQTPAEIKAVA